MNRLSVILLLLGAFASLAAAASAPTFCKCTCFTNSTIIEIKSKSSTPLGSSSSSSHLKLPSEDTTNTDEDEPALDPRSVLLDVDDSDDVDISDLLFSPPSRGSAQRPGQPQNHHPTDQRRQHARRSGGPKRAQASPSCNQCNKAFCLSQSLPICKDAADKDVVTMCFQRDSRKDQIIVWGFILGTAGLLGWAGVQRVMAMKEQGSFAGLPGLGRIGVPGGTREGVRVGAARVGATGSDAGRGAYAAVGGHSRDSSIQTSVAG